MRDEQLWGLFRVTEAPQHPHIFTIHIVFSTNIVCCTQVNKNIPNIGFINIYHALNAI